MALLASGLLDNLYQSLDAYITTTLITAAGLSVRAHGVRRFIPPTDAPWVEVHYNFLGLRSEHVRQVGGSILGTHRMGQLQCNIFQRARIFGQRYTTASARDLVVAAFPEGHIVPIHDYVGTLPDGMPAQVGCLILDGYTEQVLDTAQRSGLTQHVIEVHTRYLEMFTRP